MSQLKSVVLGEASESDNDDEVITYDKSQPIQVSIVCGEASESDDEQAPTVFQIPSADDGFASRSEMEDEKKYDSLLHKKLCESNQNLRKGITDLYKNTTTKTVKQLSTIDHNLLQSQIILQSASVHLQSVNETLSQLYCKLHGILDSDFIPDIYIPEESKS